MKKLIPIFTTILFVILNINSYSQVSLQNIVSEEISNGTRICQIKLNVQDYFDRENFSEKMVEHPKVYDFSFLREPLQCMFSSDIDFTADSIAALMNKIIEQNLLISTEKRMWRDSDHATPKEEMLENKKSEERHTLTFFFNLEDNELEEQIVEVLKQRFSANRTDDKITIEYPVIIDQEYFDETLIPRIILKIQNLTKN